MAKTAKQPAPLPPPAEDAEEVVLGSGRFELDDIGNGERLVSKFGKQIRYVADLGAWYVWNEKKQSWVGDTDEIAVMPFANKIAKELLIEAREVEEEKARRNAVAGAHSVASIGRRIAMLRSARSEPGVGAMSAEFDADKTVVACSNGTLELVPEGVKFRESRQADFATMNTGVPYLTGERHEIWDDFLELFIPDEDIRTWVQNIAGYSMYGGNPDRIMAIVQGPTTSGKSFLGSALSWALGSYAGPFKLQMLRSKQDSDLNSELAQALPRRLIVAEEASHAWKLHADEIKRLVGEVPSKARLPHAKYSIERMPAFTPWLVTNTLPDIPDADLALKRRMLFIPFEVSLSRSEEKTNYRLLLEQYGKPAVLAWAVEGWRRYAKEGASALEVPGAAVEFNMNARGNLNDFERFMAQYCVRGPEYHVTNQELFESYDNWCETVRLNSRDRWSAVKIGAYLEANGVPGRVVKIDGKARRVRVGVRLK